MARRRTPRATARSQPAGRRSSSRPAMRSRRSTRVLSLPTRRSATSTRTADPPATHVKFVVDTNQCTGQASYQGDQDNDPTNNADCLATVRASEVHATELQVFTNKASVQDSRPDGT